jgi:spermidine synthase
VATRFEELDWQQTPMGEVSLRRRRDPVTGQDVFEVKLDDDFLMSSMFVDAEVALAHLSLERLAGAAGGDGAPRLDVVVGGLGLGYTARAVLEHPGVRSLVVVEALDVVIDWHRRGLVPAAAALTSDPRCRLVPGDFFALAAGRGLDAEQPERRFDAVVVDIDHAPDHLLNPSHATFYGAAGTRALAAHLVPGGVFALWSNDPPDDGYLAVLAAVFDDVEARVVSFPNPLQGGESTNTVYLATKRVDDTGLEPVTSRV